MDQTLYVKLNSGVPQETWVENPTFDLGKKILCTDGNNCTIIQLYYS